ncbi:MAG: efflux RND transporter periplasmic adaptor subunit [Gammaproteobacteria bacterium]|nr:efflux RND transporter periplasmic adaptor subunit [Gammaproteobacteria bacterium]
MSTTPNITVKATAWRRRAAIAAVVAALLGVGIAPRIASRASLRQQTVTYSEPTVGVVYPTPGATVQHLKLPADVQAYAETGIYARTDGYLERWYADIGMHVAAGVRLADIATPEIDSQLQQARYLAATADARYQIAKVTAARWTALLETHAVSQQVSEQDVATMKVARAALAAATANVRRLEELQSYEHVDAPFSGVITARNVDVGSLISAGSTGGPGSELFHLVETDKLRVFVDVPQEYAAEVGPGTVASLTLPQHPGKVFGGRVARTAGAIDLTSRTLRIEVDFDNPDGAIMPGSYGTIDLAVRIAQPRFSLPVSALLFRPQGVEVAAVDTTGRVRLLPVELGRDFGTRIEIAAGVSGADRVIANPSDAVVSGESVRIVSGTGKPT